MKTINSIHLLGEVTNVKAYPSAKQTAVQLCTWEEYGSVGGAALAEPTYFWVTVFGDWNFEIGEMVEIKGRVKITIVQRADGSASSLWDIIAKEVKKV